MPSPKLNSKQKRTIACESIRHRHACIMYVIRTSSLIDSCYISPFDAQNQANKNHYFDHTEEMRLVLNSAHYTNILSCQFQQAARPKERKGYTTFSCYPAARLPLACSPCSSAGAAAHSGRRRGGSASPGPRAGGRQALHGLTEEVMSPALRRRVLGLARGGRGDGEQNASSSEQLREGGRDPHHLGSGPSLPPSSSPVTLDGRTTGGERPLRRGEGRRAGAAAAGGHSAEGQGQEAQPGARSPGCWSPDLRSREWQDLPPGELICPSFLFPCF